jgi:hypothetical protein
VRKGKRRRRGNRITNEKNEKGESGQGEKKIDNKEREKENMKE